MNDSRTLAASVPQVAEAAPLELTLLAKICPADDCPTVYTTNRGTVVVQGYVVDSDEAGLRLPDGERLVEIPRELLASAARVVP